MDQLEIQTTIEEQYKTVFLGRHFSKLDKLTIFDFNSLIWVKVNPVNLKVF